MRPCRRCSLSRVALVASATVFVAVGLVWRALTTASSAGFIGVSSPSREHLGPRWRPQAEQGRQLQSPGIARHAIASGSKELDTDAVFKYVSAVAVQMLAICCFLAALDAAISTSGVALPDWAVFALFFGASIRSRILSPLDNSRPDVTKATKGEVTQGFNDRSMPDWTPPGVFFPIMWILVVAPLRATATVLVWQQVGHLCDASILALMLHLSIGDTWNTVNNVERRLGAAVPGVLCVWASALFAASTYYSVLPMAGQVLLPMCLWITVAAALVTDTWRINNTDGAEPLYPYVGATRTRYWFQPE